MQTASKSALAKHLEVVLVLGRSFACFLFDVLGSSITVFAVHIAHCDQLDRLAFQLQFRQPFDVSTESATARPDEANPKFAAGSGGFRLLRASLRDGGCSTDRRSGRTS